MHAYLAHLFVYDTTTNRALLDTLRAVPDLPPHTRTVFNHLLQAKKIWIMRLRNENLAGVPVWPELTWTTCSILIDENEHAYQTYLQQKQVALTASFTYQNSKGRIFSNTIQDVLMHVLFHSSYHRGQIAAALRQQGHTPLVTDYIFHMRAEQEGL